MESQEPEGSTVGDESLDETMDRRAAIKKGVVGAAVAGVVWSAPKVQGLSLRPNYAAAGSAGGGPFNLTIPIPVNNGSTSNFPASGADRVLVTRFANSADVTLLRSGSFLAATGGNANAATASPASFSISSVGANGVFLSPIPASTSGNVNVTYNCF